MHEAATGCVPIRPDPSPKVSIVSLADASADLLSVARRVTEVNKRLSSKLVTTDECLQEIAMLNAFAEMAIAKVEGR
jgi:hypothetical protein